MKNFIALSVILITAGFVKADKIDHSPIEKPVSVDKERIEEIWAIDKDGKMVKVPVTARGCASGKCPLPNSNMSSGVMQGSGSCGLPTQGVQGGCANGRCPLPSSGVMQGNCAGGSCGLSGSGMSQGNCAGGSCQSGVSRGRFGSRMGFGSGSCGGFGSRLNWYPGKFMGRIFGR